MKNTPQGLSQSDMQDFLRVLSLRNEKSSIPVPPELVRSVEKMGGMFIAQLLTGDSLTLDMQVIPQYQMKSQATVMQGDYMAPGVYNSLGGNGITGVQKARADLTARGVKFEGFSQEEILQAHYLVNAFSNNKEPLSTETSAGENSEYHQRLNNALHSNNAECQPRNSSNTEEEFIQKLINLWNE